MKYWLCTIKGAEPSWNGPLRSKESLEPGGRALFIRYLTQCPDGEIGRRSGLKIRNP
jgi:hypothetical protein